MNMSAFKNKVYRFFPSFLFLCFLVIGLCVYDDYGISDDESIERETSLINYRYINRKLINRGVFVTQGTEDLMNYRDKYYGVAFQLPLIFFEDVYQLITRESMPFATIFHMRHLYCYILYLFGLFCFYKLLKDVFHSQTYAVTGILMIYTFGRFFAESFYNIKDLVFASSVMITLYCAEMLFRTQYSSKWCVLFAISIAFTVNTRIVGALIPLFTVIILTVDHLVSRKTLPLKPLLLIGICLPVYLLIMPSSWENPITFTLSAISKFTDFTDWNDIQMFGGKFITIEEIPSDFYIRWICITVPIIYLLFQICGTVFFIKRLLNKTGEKSSRQILLVIGFLFTGTILYQAVFRPVVYCAWRHIYYCFPLIIPFSLLGFHDLMERFHSSAVRWILSGLLAGSILYNGIQLITNHPGQYVAMNTIGKAIGEGYTSDYWRMTFYPSLRWIASQDNGDSPITVSKTDPQVYSRNLRQNILMLPESEREKLSFSSDDPDYIIRLEREPLTEPYEIAGYEKVKTFSYYDLKQSAIYKRAVNNDE